MVLILTTVLSGFSIYPVVDTAVENIITNKDSFDGKHHKLCIVVMILTYLLVGLGEIPFWSFLRKHDS
jgi:hypothetical protein